MPLLAEIRWLLAAKLMSWTLHLVKREASTASLLQIAELAASIKPQSRQRDLVLKETADGAMLRQARDVMRRHQEDVNSFGAGLKSIYGDIDWLSAPNVKLGAPLRIRPTRADG